MADGQRIPVDPNTGEPMAAAPAQRIPVDPNTGDPIAAPTPMRIPVNPDTGAPLGQKTAPTVKPPEPTKGDFGWLQPVADWWKGERENWKPRPGEEAARESSLTGKAFFNPVSKAFAEQGSQTIERNVRSLATDVTKPLDAKKGVWATPARVGKTGLDIAVAAFTPIEATYRTVVGKPVEAATGGKVSPETAGNAAMLAEGALHLAQAAPKLIKALPKLQEGLKTAGNFVKAAVAPSTVSKESYQTSKAIRGAGGRNQLDAEKAAATLLRMDKQANANNDRSPGYFRNVINYIENRSKAAKPGPDGKFYHDQQLYNLGLTSADKPLVDTVRDILVGYREKAEAVIAKNVGEAPRFIKDYYTHLWQEKPEVVQQKMEGFFRQGSAKNFRARSIPTIEDGIEAGLTPKSMNPIETTTQYAQNMSNFLTTHEVQGWAKAQGYAKWFAPGAQPEGWVPLNGILTERVPRGQAGRPAAGPSSYTDAPAYTKLPAPEDPALGGPGAQKALPNPHAPLVGEVLPPEGPPAGQKALPGGPRAVEPHLENITPKAEEAARKTADRAPRKQVLYAPEDVARVYNNWISSSLASESKMGKGFDALQKGLNTGKALKFGLSGYHALTMGWESAISQVARGIQSAAVGKPLTAAKQLLTAPGAAVTSGLRGAKMERQLLGIAPKAASPEEARINKLFIDSGGRLKMDKLYRTTESRNFYQALKSGTLRQAIGDAVEQMYGKDKTIGGRVAAHAKAVANAAGSLTAPLFEDIIPAIKRGAFADRMGDWLKQNPDATEEQASDFAVKLNDSMDNRFGEMVSDNMFWNRRAKQVAQMALLSASWTIGTAREIGGGLADVIPSAKSLVQGKGISDRTAYVAALLSTVATADAVMTYLKTGEGPKSVQDLEAYRTGGTDTRLHPEAPERAMFPGYQKDVYAAADASTPGSGGYLGMLRSKLDPSVSLALDLATNTDFAGRKVYGGGARNGALIDRVADAYDPFTLAAAVDGKLKGSNISGVEKALGAKPAPVSITNPEALKHLRDSQMKREKKTAEKSHRRQQARRVSKDDPTKDYMQ